MKVELDIDSLVTTIEQQVRDLVQRYTDAKLAEQAKQFDQIVAQMHENMLELEGRISFMEQSNGDVD
jgi:hypothetical protein